MKKAEDNQCAFPFIDQVRQDRYWYLKPGMEARLIQSLDQPKTTPIHKPPIRFALISCSKSKLETEAPARDLYTGQLFRKAVAWAERQQLQWFVVSALHGLLLPDQTVSPYNYTVKNLRVRERQQWAHTVVAGSLTRYAPPHSHAILILPELYRRFIEFQLFHHKITYENPLKGLGIGQQLKWLADN